MGTIGLHKGSEEKKFVCSCCESSPGPSSRLHNHYTDYVTLIQSWNYYVNFKPTLITAKYLDILK